MSIRIMTILTQLIDLAMIIGVVVFMITTVNYLRGIYLTLKNMEERLANRDNQGGH